MTIRHSIILTYVVQVSAVVFIVATAVLNWLVDVSRTLFWLQIACVVGLAASAILNGVLRRRLRLLLKQEKFLAAIRRAKGP